jgi:hypothetical protein
VLTVAPLIASAVALLGAVVAFGTARRAHTLAVQATAAEDRRGRSEETMRLLRWAVELAVNDEVRYRSAGVAVLGLLVKARLVVRGDRAFIEGAATQIALLAEDTHYAADQSLNSAADSDGGSHG